jgi:peptidoglycan/LPS O-acetylase OafA/YrhL
MMYAMHKPRHAALLFAVFCSLAGLAPAAHAYLDPSTGSMILSAIVGLFATIGLAVKTYWYKLKNLVMRRPPAPPPGPAGEPAPPAGQQSGQQSGQPSRLS